MSRKHVLAVLVVLLTAAGAGGYFLYRWMNPPPADSVALVPGPARTRTPANVPAVRFTDVTASCGVRFVHTNGATPQKLLPETMCGGVAVLDYDGDGKPDVLFVNSRPWPGHESGPLPTPKLFRNHGDWVFEDVTAEAGLGVPLYGMGVAVGDVDNDGRPDVFISCVGKHRLFRNVDGKRFEDATDAAKVGGPGKLPEVSKAEFLAWKEPIPFGASGTFLDYDGDGRLDLFVCHYVTWSPAIDLSVGSTATGAARTYQQPQQLVGAQCGLFRNVDGKSFEDVSASAGVVVSEKEGTDATSRVRPVGKALGVVVCDPDGDGWPDLMVANDTVPNFFFHNRPGPNGGRVFEERGFATGSAYADEGKPRGGMGIDWGEFAYHRSAVVVANFANEPLTFLERDPMTLRFSDSALAVGLAGPSRVPLKFGTFFFDYDNDGRLDLLVNNGHIEPEIAAIQTSQRFAQPPQLFWNTGDPECYFEPATAARAGDDLFAPLVGRGSAFADLDGDGDLDVILVANGGHARVLRNDAPAANHWLRLDLRGDGKASCTSAIGAVVTVEAGGKVFNRQVTGGRGYLSQSELVLGVGLGPAISADRVTVRWPGKAAAPQTWTNLAAGRVHILKQGEPK